MKRRLLLLGLQFFVSCILCAQVKISAATGLSALHNFSPQQQFWTFGQTIRSFFHFAPKQAAYAWLDYYAEGQYENNLTATAKSPATVPPQVNYQVSSRMTFVQLSLGWKHYFKGSYQEESTFNIYGTAGFGILFGKVINLYPVDTASYHTTPLPGEGRFRKLTFDLALGMERPLGGPFYFFADVRSWLPASSDTSPYLVNQKNVPLTAMLSAGMRILFGSSY